MVNATFMIFIDLSLLHTVYEDHKRFHILRYGSYINWRGFSDVVMKSQAFKLYFSIW